MTFAREDASTGNTYAAQVSAFAMPSFRTGDELVAIVRAGFAKDTSPDRFKVIDDEFRLTDERPYPCVRLRGTYEDLKARTRRGTVALPLHIRSLYCQHPARSDMGLHMAYSQRGGPPDPDLDSQAQSFFEGVQVSRGGR